MKTKILVLSCAMTLTSAAYAQTWVSKKLGNDSNPCTTVQPCATFQRAVNAAPAWGEVNVLDPGDFGSFAISKAITIDGGGFAANVVAPYGGIGVYAGPSDIVQIRNLSLHGNGASSAIYFQSGGQLQIDNVQVSGFGGFCIDVALNSGAGSSDLVIKDTNIDNCSAAGIGLQSNHNFSAEIINTHVHFANYGLWATNGVISVSGSTFSSAVPNLQAGAGILLNSAATIPVFLMVDNCQISGFYYGVLGIAGTAQFSRSTFTNNLSGVNAGSSTIFSNGNNAFFNNGAIGSFTSTVSLY